MGDAKNEVICFKVDRDLSELMRGIDNRSGFIHKAILDALDNCCPLCKGTGVLTPKQKTHWVRFAKEHPVEECDDCHEYHLTCSVSDDVVQDGTSCD